MTWRFKQKDNYIYFVSAYINILILFYYILSRFFICIQSYNTTLMSSFLVINLLFVIRLNNFLHCCRRYGTKCGGCGQGISPCDLVRKARDKVFHLNCFTCLVCRKQLSTGEELYVLDDNKFICKEDYLNGNKASVISSHQGKIPT